MEFGNYKKTIEIKLRKFVIAMICMLIIIFALMTEWFNFWDQSDIHIVIIIASLYTLYYIWDYIMDYHYFYFSDNENKLVFRFYTLRFLQKVNKAIEIPKSSFAGYEIIFKAGRLKSFLVVRQRSERKDLKYPGINISLLSKSEKNKLINSLNKYV